jgi:hypothetical protein
MRMAGFGCAKAAVAAIQRTPRSVKFLMAASTRNGSGELRILLERSQK